MGKARRAISGDGSVYPRKDGRYAGSFKTESGKRVYVYAPTEKEALAKLREKQREDAAGMLVTAPNQTLKSYLEYWLSVQKVSLKPSAYDTYKKLLVSYVLPNLVLANTKLRDLKAEHIQRLLAKLLQQQNLSAGTVRMVYGVLSTSLVNAVEWQKIAFNPCASVKPPHEESHEMTVLSSSQARQLLAAAKGRPLEALLTVALATGMRRGELIGLKWDDIDLEKGILQVKRTVAYLRQESGGSAHIESAPKTKASARVILLPRFVVEALRLHRSRQLEYRRKAGAKWQEKGLVFPTSVGGYEYPQNLHEQFQRIVCKAALPDMRFHDVRHTCATLLLQRGVHVKVVSEMLGHSDIAVTLNTYAHVLPTMQQTAMREMEELFREVQA